MGTLEPVQFFKSNPSVAALFSKRAHGNMKLGGEKSKENRKGFFEQYLLPETKIIAADIVHGGVVVTIEKETPSVIHGADGLVTKEKGVALSVTGADCPVVYAWDPESKIIGIAHAGWKGIKAGVVMNLIKEMYGLDSGMNQIRIAVSPAICGGCYEFARAWEEFGKEFPECVIGEGNSKPHLTLKGIICRQLKKNFGVRNVENGTGYCTCCSRDKTGKNLFFSARREKFPPDKIKSQIALIVMV